MGAVNSVDEKQLVAGADLDLERTAAIAWPVRRAAHIVTANATVVAILSATALTGDALTHAVRSPATSSGWADSWRSARPRWVPPAPGCSRSPGSCWSRGSPHLLEPHPPAPPKQMLTWLMQPPETISATVTAVILGAAGTLAYAILGPRR